MRRSTVLQKELEEIQSNPSDDYKCLALPSDPYDLQFAIRGPKGTDFEGGIFHGRMLFSKEYPDIIPSIMFLANFYLFGTHTEINFSHNLYKSFTDGALGSVGYNKKKRRALAIKSREAALRYGTAERQKLTDEIQEYMLSKAPPLPSNKGGDIQASYQNDLDKRKPGINILVGNTINANNSKQVGIFEFENNCSKKAKQVISS